MGDENYSAAIYLNQLKQKLPKEGKDLLSGATSVEEAWDILGHHYGNREMIVATVIQELIETKLTQGAAHKGLEQLCQAVQRATLALR